MFTPRIGHRGHGLLALLLALALIVSLTPGLATSATDALDSLQASPSSGPVLDPALSSALAVATSDELLEVIITYWERPDQAEVAALAALGIRDGYTFQSLPMIAVGATRAQIEAILARPGVRSLYLDKPLTYYLSQSKAFIGVERLMKDAEFQSWNGGFPITGRGVGVAVIDTGIDATHPDLPLGSKVTENVKILAGRLNTNLGQGIIPLTTSPTLPDTDTSSGHGTHVAGIVGGTGISSPGAKFAGVASGANLIGIGTGDALSILYGLAGFDYAITNRVRLNIRVITNSWGSTGGDGEYNPNEPINVASKLAYDLGMVVLFASGNDGGYNVLNPYSVWPWVIGVAAGTKDGRLASFSSRGVNPELESAPKPFQSLLQPTVTAPGVDIISTRDASSVLPPLSASQDLETMGPAELARYTTMSGTSMATPHVAGVVALLLEADPRLTPAQVKQFIVDTATPMAKQKPFEVGAGYVNAYAAVQKALYRRWLGKTQPYGQAYRQPPEPIYSFVVQGEPTIEQGTYLTGVRQFNPFSVPFTTETALVRIDKIQLNNTSDLIVRTGNLFYYDPDQREVGSTAVPTLIPFPRPGTWFHNMRGALSSASGTGGVERPKDYSFRATRYRLELTDTIFAEDVASLSAPDRLAIKVMVALGQVRRDADGRFNPDRLITRAELARALALGGRVPQYLPAHPSYRDVPESDPNYAYIEAVRDARILSGAGDTFDPDGGVRKLDLAVALVKAAGLEAEAKARVGDTSFTYYYYENGIEKSTQVALDDRGEIPAEFVGYAAVALDRRLVRLAPPTYTVDTSNPDWPRLVIHYRFEPQAPVNRNALTQGVYQLIGVLF